MHRAGIALACHVVVPGSIPGKDKSSISDKSLYMGLESVKTAIEWKKNWKGNIRKGKEAVNNLLVCCLIHVLKKISSRDDIKLLQRYL